MPFLLFAFFEKELNLAVVGSQIVGLVPLKAMLDTADYYMEKENLFILEEDQKLRLVRFFLVMWCFIFK